MSHTDGGPPPDISRVHSFVNTLDLRRFLLHGRPLQGGDALTSPAALADWLDAAGLPGFDAAPTPADLQFARHLRALLREATMQPDDPAYRPAEPVSLTGLLTVTVAPAAAPVLAPTRTGVRGALAVIVAEAVVAGANGRWRRLKMCPAPDCRWVFYDQSRPANGRWCDPARCGNRMKTRAYRTRGRTPDTHHRG